MTKTPHHALMSVLAVLLLATPALADDHPDKPGPDAKPVKVYILSGQSNMVGIGQVDAGGTRWGKEFIDPVLSVYPGKYDPEADYDKLDASQTLELESFGGTSPTAYPGGGVQVVRGEIKMGETGVYEFRPGYGGSTENIMVVDGKEVYRKEPGGKAKHTHIKLEAGEKVPFKITYLNNQANGLGWYARMDVPGTLSTLVRQQGKYPHLIDEDGGWVSRDDVWYKGVVTAVANKWLSIGCGASNGSIGPELGFGWQLGDYHDEPVLVLKASQGNRSLGWDFLPPGSERVEAPGKDKDGNPVTYVYAGYKDSPSRWIKGTDPEPINWYAGKQYDECFDAAKDVLANFDQNFPMWEGRGYEIAGFVWWQGHKDSGSDVHRSRYEHNLVTLINTLRKEFKAADAPFIVGTIGFGGFDGMADQFKPIAEAQLAVSDYAKYPQYEGNVKTVETRGFWREADVSPRNQDFHYHGNAGTYYDIGDAFGKAMIQMLKADEGKE